MLFFLFLGYLNISREVFLISLYVNVASMLFEWFMLYLLAIFFFLGLTPLKKEALPHLS